ncbi:MAG: 4-amino-4-deoxy-L-arabinose transferase-like glycosyltransferase [Planctomycetota bacterium]|jgi:4-amino-4-deoxy-L-arabinose transferase-like glycosyltransferase
MFSSKTTTSPAGKEAGPAAGGNRARVDRTTWWVAGIALLAFVLRLIYVLQTRANPFFYEPIMDPKYHVDWARAFAAGENFQEGSFFRAPLYPWFLGGLFKLFGDGLLLPRVVQCLLGSCTTVLVFLLGRDAFDRRTGLLASLGAATYWVLIYFDGELLIPALAVPLNLLALWLTLRLDGRVKTGGAFLAGLAWGLAAIARPNVLILMPVFFFWLIWRAWGDRRAALFAGAALTLGTLTPILPISAYNAAQGDFALVATQAGVNLWIGNNPEHAALGDVSTAIVPGTRQGWWEGFHDAVALAEEAEGRDLKSSEVSAHYTAKAWDWISSEPGAASRHWLQKLRLFWSAEELGNNQPVRGFARHFGPITKFLPLGFGVVAPLGLLGFALVLLNRGGKRASLLPLWSFLLIYSLTVVTFFINGRFRLPVLPVLLVLGAHATLWLFEQGRQRSLGALGGAGLFLALTGFVALSTPEKYRQDEATTFYQLGVAAVAAGDHRGALEQFDLALGERPAYTQASTGKAQSLIALGRPVEAERAFETAFSTGTKDREALQAYASFLMSSPGRVADAVVVARTLVHEHPSFSAGHYLLGRGLGEAGDLPGSEKAFRAGLLGSPGDYNLNLGLGMSLALQDRFQDAVEPLTSAYQASVEDQLVTSEDPAQQTLYWRGALQLFQALHLAARPQDATRFLGELGQRHPGDGRVAEIGRNKPR